MWQAPSFLTPLRVLGQQPLCNKQRSKWASDVAGKRAMWQAPSCPHSIPFVQQPCCASTTIIVAGI
eukprot:638283-Pelagomonas_calceolata.AAC.1